MKKTLNNLHFRHSKPHSRWIFLKVAIDRGPGCRDFTIHLIQCPYRPSLRILFLIYFIFFVAVNQSLPIIIENTCPRLRFKKKIGQDKQKSHLYSRLMCLIRNKICSSTTAYQKCSFTNIHGNQKTKFACGIYYRCLCNHTSKFWSIFDCLFIWRPKFIMQRLINPL